MDQGALPDPDSEHLRLTLGTSQLRLLYGLLYRRRDSPPTVNQARFFLENASNAAGVDFEALLTALRRHFTIRDAPLGERDQSSGLALVGWVADGPTGHRPMSTRLRAEVLAPQRCEQCGRTPRVHGVVLTPTERIPLAWGGSQDRENLEALCEECAVGREQYFARWSHLADKVRYAITRDEPQARIGELLKAMHPNWVPADLLEAVASAREYQDDWQRRLRDLRFLGWKVTQQNRKQEGARTRSYYRLEIAQEWPDNIRAAITAEERRRLEEKRSANQPKLT